MMSARVSERVTLFVMFLWLVGVILTGCSGPQPATAPLITPIAQIAMPSSAHSTPASRVEYWPTESWRTSTPQEQGMDPQKLAQMLQSIEKQGLDLHSLLVIRNGFIVSETYWKPYKQTTRHELYSCTKSFISTLFGIAVDRGAIQSTQRSVLALFPDGSFGNRDTRKEAMTVDDLLTMRSGLDWEEADLTYREMYQSSDWVRYVLDKPMMEEPGSRFNYCSGCSHVLSAIIQQETATSTLDLAEKALFEPLGIVHHTWERDSQGIANGGWGLQMTPREMAKLGYLYLHEGMWDGQRLVSAEWIKAATEKKTATDSPLGLGYGYQWWTYPDRGAYAALGLYGQTIFVVPDLALIVVTTAEVDGHEVIFDLIEEYILPAVGNP